MIKAFIPAIYSLGPLDFYTYGTLIGLGIMVIYYQLDRKFGREITGIDYLILLLSIFIGAKALYIAHNLDQIATLQDIIQMITSGGLALFGALIGGIASIYYISHRRNVNLLQITDLIALYLPIAQILGRIGNFANNELYGKPTDLPWSLYVAPEHRTPPYLTETTFHPAFLYEIICSLINLAILHLINRSHNLTRGLLTAIYLINYGLIRLILNRVRFDKGYILGIESSDLGAILMILIAAVILWKIRTRDEQQKSPQLDRIAT